MINFPRWYFLGLFGSVATVSLACHPGVNGRSSLSGPFAQKAEPLTAFVDVAVIPMDRDRVLVHQTVLVRGDRITMLGPVARIHVPTNAVSIDGRGKFLIPGLADMHYHLAITDSANAERALVLLVVNGVTTIRNLDYFKAQLNGDDLLRLRARAAAHQLLSPRIYTSGKWNTNPQLNVAQQIAAYKAAGYDFIKVRDEDSVTIDSIAAGAHRVGIPFVGHVNDSISLAHAINLGYLSIEHLTGYPRAISRGEGSVQTLATTTQRAKIWNCPTHALSEVVDSTTSSTTLEQWPELQYTAAGTHGIWRFYKAIGRSTGAPLDELRHLIVALQAAGAGILSGTDGPLMPYMFPGFSLHRELAALVHAGLTPYQALATSTKNVAIYFGTLKESGTVAMGKRADLVLLDGNPLVDISNTARIRGVMLDGLWISRTELDQRLADEIGKFDISQNAP